MTEELLAAACGLDSRTWRRWKSNWPTRGANRGLVAAILDGWLRVRPSYCNWQQLSAWRADPVQLATFCLTDSETSTSTSGQLTGVLPAITRSTDRFVRPHKGRARLCRYGHELALEVADSPGVWSWRRIVGRELTTWRPTPRCRTCGVGIRPPDLGLCDHCAAAAQLELVAAGGGA